MNSFGQTVLLWRLERRLSQAQLAIKAKVPRPNLSAIEKGKREVSLKTIRSLAAALDVKPGILVDGVAPKSWEGNEFSRSALERIARAAAGNHRLENPGERLLADRLKLVLHSRLNALKPEGRWT